MFYNKNELERMRKEGEEYSKKWELEKELKARGNKYQSVDETQIICIHCKHEYFQEGNALLNTRGLTFFDLDWLNEGAITLTCTKCGFIHWFAKEVKEIE